MRIKHSFITKLAIVGLAVTIPFASFAGSIPFDGSWKKQSLLKLWSNKYGLNGSRLSITSDGSVSLIYRAVPKADWNSKSASWSWAVSEGVKATNLAKKGGDDRNISIYFVFVDKATAESGSFTSARALLSNKNAKSLAYVWGGNHKRGSILKSPYSPSSLKTVIKRSAGTGSFSEKVNLAADYKRAFGKSPEVLIGIAVSADSDDTKGKIKATISNLKLR